MMHEQVVIERRLDITWRMLATLGAPVQAPAIESAPVDPEGAVVLASLGGRDDARMLELAVWFAASSRRSLSLTRLRSIAAAFGEAGEQALREFVRAAGQLPELRPWVNRLVSADSAPSGTGIDISRFRDRMGAAAPSDMVVRGAGALRLRLRLAFGMGARTEALAALLVHAEGPAYGPNPWITLPELEAMTDFGKRHLLDSLPDMARVGLLQHRRAGRVHEFRATSGILSELGPLPPRWISWTPHMAAVLRLEAAIALVDDARTLGSVMDARRMLEPLMRELGLTMVEASAGNTGDLVVDFLAWALDRHLALLDIE